MPNLYLENGKSGGKRIETGRERGLRGMQGMNLAFVAGRELRSRRGSRLSVSARSRWEVEEDRHRYLGFGGRGLGTPVVS
jgi:hypothetical protein